MLKRPGLISGRLAQLVERFVYTEDVGGSSPSSPTMFSKAFRIFLFRAATETATDTLDVRCQEVA